MEKPTDADEGIRPKPIIGEVSNERCERKFPYPKSAVKVGGAGTGYHDGIKISSVRLPKKRARTDVHNRYEHRSN
jgi:hypothetical protein